MADREKANLNYCYKCMRLLEEGITVCPHCGHDNTVHENVSSTIPEGMILNGRYLVGKVIGHGGFGITYIGVDIMLKVVRVAIKEYFPVGMCVRNPDTIRVTAITEKTQQDFQKGCEEFHDEAVRLAQIDSPNIVRVRDYFLENGTAYIVMDYVGGKTVTEAAAENGGKIPWQRTLDLFKPIILELDRLHQNRLIHRDIKPDNLKIDVDKNGKEHLILLDFGAARSFISPEQTKTYTAMFTPGYAPLEQYSTKSRQGPFTDVYALCASMYAVLTGTVPTAATDRADGEAELPSITSISGEVPEQVEKAILHGLAVRKNDRTQTMRELYEELTGEPVSDSKEQVETADEKSEPGKQGLDNGKCQDDLTGQKNRKKRWLVPVLLFALCAAGFFIFNNNRQNKANDFPAQTVASTATALPVSTNTPESTATSLPTSTDTPEPTATPLSTSTDTPEPTATPLPTSTNTPEPTATPLSTSTDTPEPTATPLPTSTNTPESTEPPLPTTTDTPEPTKTPAAVILKTGDMITFGRFEQDNNRNNGKEAIEWQVLSVVNDRALLISRYALEARAYNDKSENITWENCTLRKWLNGDFYNDAFSSSEKGQIVQVTNQNPINPDYGTDGGKPTTDKIFLLSIDEVKQNFSDSESLHCQATDHAIANGVDSSYFWWWLRSPGSRFNTAAGVSSYGDLSTIGGGVDSSVDAVRPVLWMKLPFGM